MRQLTQLETLILKDLWWDGDRYCNKDYVSLKFNVTKKMAAEAIKELTRLNLLMENDIGNHRLVTC